MKLSAIIRESTVDEVNIFYIPADRMWSIYDVVEKLNKKAEEFGSHPILIDIVEKTYKDVPSDTETGEAKKMLYYKIKIIGQSPKINGWELIGSLDYVDKSVIIRAVPGKSIPHEFRDTSPTRCDFCNTKRDRVNSFILQHENGDVQQVGRSCLKNFLGNVNPKALFAFVNALDKVLDDIKKGIDPDQSKGDKDRKYTSYDLTYTLAMTAAIIEQYGWVSVSEAKYKGIVSTAARVFDQINYHHRYTNNIDSDPLTPEQRHYDTANDVIDWVRNTLTNKSNKSNYEHNLVVLTRDDSFRTKYLGTVVSLIKAKSNNEDYDSKKAEREKEKQRIDLERKTRSAGSQYVGNVGDKLGAKGGTPLRLRLLKLTEFQGPYGLVRLYRFEDSQGNFFVWFANTNAEMEEGAWYNVQGTVKKHEEDKYNHGAKTTYLTRVKVI